MKPSIFIPQLNNTMFMKIDYGFSDASPVYISSPVDLSKDIVQNAEPVYLAYNEITEQWNFRRQVK